jgi:tetratricopeptide (TPR) repeat protein
MDIRLCLALLFFIPLSAYGQKFEQKHAKEAARIEKYLESNQCDRAFSMLQTYLSPYARDPFVLEAAARAYYCMNKYPEAVYYYDRLISVDPENQYAYIGRAQVYISMRQFENGKRDLETAQKIVDKWSEINNQDYRHSRFLIQSTLAWMYETEKKYAEAAECYDILVSLEPENSNILATFGLNLGLSDKLRLSEAHEAIDQAARIAPTSTIPAIKRYFLLLAYDQHEEALSSLELAYSLNKEDTFVLIRLGGELIEHKRYTEAIKHFERAMELGAQQIELHRMHARALGFLGRYEQSIAAYDRILFKNPGVMNVVVGRSIVLIAMGDTALALRDFDKMMESEKASNEYAFQRGVLIMEMGRYEQAITFFDRALQVDEGYKSARNNRAYCNWRLARLVAALEDIEYLLRHDPEEASYLGFRGTIRHEMGLHELALADFASVLELRPERHITIFERSKTYEFLEQYDKALADCEAALRLDPENPEYKAAIVRIKSKQAGK